MCQHNLPCSIVYAHCLLPGRAFASLYVLLFLEKEAEIGGRDLQMNTLNDCFAFFLRHILQLLPKSCVFKVRQYKMLVFFPSNYDNVSDCSQFTIGEEEEEEEEEEEDNTFTLCDDSGNLSPVPRLVPPPLPRIHYFILFFACRRGWSGVKMS